MNKTILITGSTDGIGKLAAIKLAKDGHHLYLHGRNEAKLSSVISEVKNESKNDNIKGFVADFSDLSAVKNMATQVTAEIENLDVLINNAGVYTSAVSKTSDHLDIRFGVNYFAPYLLTKALLPLLKKSDAPKIINLSSAAQSSVSFEALDKAGEIFTEAAYAQSKLALTMWSFYLAKSEPEVDVIAVNPGSLLNTKMVREGFGRYWSPADKGGDILYDLAVAKEYEGISGKYFDNDAGGFGTPHPDAKNELAIQKLIKKTEEILQSKV